MKSPAEVDYIIVGAGSAGCAVANRLSQDSSTRVLLLEAGGRDWNPLIRIPLLTRIAFSLPSLNWGYETEEEPHLKRRRVPWPRGRVLGGSSSINGMTYIRGHPRDFDDWRQSGCEGWSYDDVLPYFRRSERNAKGGPYHGADGPMGVSRSAFVHPLDECFMGACAALGSNPTTDFNGEAQEGHGLHDFTILNGRRQSASVAFLRPISGRDNLRVETRAVATRVLIENGRAAGVEFSQHGQIRSVRATREVVLCGGTVNSPQLLMLSGIGEGEALREHKIPVAIDLPGVGRNLQDHLGTYVAQECTQPITLRQQLRYDRAAFAVIRALLWSSGPATAIPISACAFLKTRPDLEVPDVQITLIPGLVVQKPWPRPDRDGFLVHVYQLRPESRGDIRLRSSDPFERPVIRANYLAAANDRRTMRDGIRMVRKLIAENPFDPVRGAELSPGPAVESDAGIDDWIAAFATTSFHPVGTCRMGTDPDAVVDPRLRIRGIEGLRVADASIMPTLVGGNTNAAAIMIGEKAADLILGQTPSGAR